MKLSRYLQALGLSPTTEDPEITSAVNDSRQVHPGSLFCAIPGAKIDGSIFIPDAVKAGAAAIVAAEKHPELSIPCITVRDLYRTWGLICETEAGFPAQNISMHAVTGTNGKTTTAMILRKIFSEAFPQEKCGLVSTIFYDACLGLPEEASRTTPDAKGFQKILTDMKNNGCTRAVMETSSHGLHQHRTGSMKVRSAIFTNLTGDHLDYHRTMENYFQAKRILFAEMLAPNGHAVINLEDPWGRRLAKEFPEAITYSAGTGAKARFIIKENSASGTVFDLETDFGTLHIQTNLIGYCNVCNMTGAALAALADGVPANTVQRILCRPTAVPGRLEGFDLPNGARIFVDYAHTDDALERMLGTLRPLVKSGGRLFCVFGCGGDRDRTKRPRMGKAAVLLADRVIVTDDNPRTERPEDIAEEILSGMPDVHECIYVSDRAEAIRKAVSEAGPEDLILLAGKGHEKTQEIAGVKYPFDDCEEIRKIIAESNIK